MPKWYEMSCELEALKVAGVDMACTTSGETAAKGFLVVGMGAYAFGREKRAVHMLRYMKRVKPFFLISPWGDGSVARLLDRYGFRYECAPFGYLGRARPKWTLITLSRMPELWFRFLRAYRRSQCQGVLVLCVHPFLNAFIPLLVVKYLFQAEIVPYFGDIPSVKGVHRFIGRLINHWCDQVLVNSQAVKQGLVKVGVREERIRVIYNGVNLEKFNRVEPLDFRRRFGWPADSVVVGFLGQFTENKGVWDFVHAAERVLKSNKRCRFVLIGKLIPTEPRQQEVLDYIRERELEPFIQFAGWIEEVERAYAGLDVVVVPSRFEDPAPNVVLEAMATGVPVVGTRAGGMPELIVDGETGFLVDKGHPEQLAERILQLATNPDLRQRIGEMGRKRVSKMFDIYRNARVIEEVLLNE